ncbi:MAG: single-stranded DNA-binding protein [Oscillospiraceae bacterium]|nr:single-stranded DNA-binding protein [Oscillospiraceae bacterium]
MYNKAIIMGRLTADPELRQTPSNISVTSFTVACDRAFSKGAERQADFIDCVAWRGTAEFVCRYFQKGKPILVEGRLQVTNYTDKNGEKRRRYEVVADNVHFVDGSKNNSGGDFGNTFSAPANNNTNTGVAFSSGNTEDFEEIGGLDDLPF